MWKSCGLLAALISLFTEVQGWSVYKDNGEFCNTTLAVTTVGQPYKESCLKFCEDYIMEYCMLEKSGREGECMASSFCDTTIPSHRRDRSYTIFRGAAYRGGECTIPGRFHGDWWVYNGPKAFHLEKTQLTLFENFGTEAKYFRCEFQNNDVILLKYLKTINEEGETIKPRRCCDSYVCFKIDRVKDDVLKVEIITNDSHDGSGMYLVPLTKGVSIDEVCSGTVSEIHLLTSRPTTEEPEEVETGDYEIND